MPSSISGKEIMIVVSGAEVAEDMVMVDMVDRRSGTGGGALRGTPYT